MNVYARLNKPVRFDTIQALLSDIWQSEKHARWRAGC
jgi:hypothetical protein